jgi:transposase
LFGEDLNDAVWLAKLTERGMLRPSFVPPPEIRRLREFTRLRADLVHDRTRHWARLEKLLERALIKISDVTSTLDLKSVRAMIEALIAGQRGPRILADLARGPLRKKPPWPRRWTAGSRTTTARSPGSCWTRSTASPPRSRP